MLFLSNMHTDKKYAPSSSSQVCSVAQIQQMSWRAKRRPRGSAGRRPSLKWATTADRSQFHTLQLSYVHVIRSFDSTSPFCFYSLSLLFDPLVLAGHAGSPDHQPVQKHLPAGGPGSLCVSLQGGGHSPGGKFVFFLHEAAESPTR